MLYPTTRGAIKASVLETSDPECLELKGAAQGLEGNHDVQIYSFTW